MRIPISLVSLAGRVAAVPTPNTPQPFPPDTVSAAALATAGDTMVCQSTLGSGPCETVHAQGACVTLDDTTFHKVRNIYQAKGSVCKYLDRDCSAPRPVVSIHSNKENLWLHLEPEIGDQIGLVLCRNDWPNAQLIEAGAEKRGFPVCHWNQNRGKYVCDGEMAHVEVAGNAGVTVRGFPSCHFDVTKGRYVCDGKTAAAEAGDIAISKRQFPACHWDVKKGRYICDGKTATQANAGIVARQFPSCHFNAKLGEYVCDGETAAPANSGVNARQMPSCHLHVSKDDYVCDGEPASQPDNTLAARQFPHT